jgi:hypothetical protein
LGAAGFAVRVEAALADRFGAAALTRVRAAAGRRDFAFAFAAGLRPGLAFGRALDYFACFRALRGPGLPAAFFAIRDSLTGRP